MSIVVKISVATPTVKKLSSFLKRLESYDPGFDDDILFNVSSDGIFLSGQAEDDIKALFEEEGLTILSSSRPAWDLKVVINLFQLIQLCRFADLHLSKKDIPFFTLSFEDGFQGVGVYLLSEGELAFLKDHEYDPTKLNELLVKKV